MFFYKKYASNKGFALLMTIIVVGVVLSVGLAVLDLSIKQVRLSSQAKESEIAFHAANAGLECARHVRRTHANSMEDGLTTGLDCFGVAAATSSFDIGANGDIDDMSDGNSYRYAYDLTWGASSDRCSRIVTVVASTTPTGNGATTTNISTYVPGYPAGSDDWYCEAGARCTIISVRGYNRPCNALTGYGIIEREVLLQF